MSYSNMIEFVNVSFDSGSSWKKISDDYEWHSIVWLETDSASSNMKRRDGKSSIGKGHKSKDTELEESE